MIELTNRVSAYGRRVILCAVIEPLQDHNPYFFEELEGLATTAGAYVIAKIIQKRDRPDPRYLVGKGKLDEITEIVKQKDIQMIIFDNSLSPVQVRNLTHALAIPVFDRTELILDIFATHAQTRQAKLQVELASLEYLLPRLRGLGLQLSQQRGGIGQRGPGETKLEEYRRLLKERIFTLKQKIKKIEARKEREVKSRISQNFTISLVGYTNAGKTTLMNALSKSNLYVDDKLFSTLDTKTNLWNLKNGMKVLLSDTVGFIQNLPHTLVSSFHATLEEARQADLLLHVVDASSPFYRSQIASVQDVLNEIGCHQQTILVLNKIDKFVDKMAIQVLQNEFREAVCISALTGQGLDLLEDKIIGVLSQKYIEMTILVPFSENSLVYDAYRHATVLENKTSDRGTLLRLKIPAIYIHKFEKYKI